MKTVTTPLPLVDQVLDAIRLVVGKGPVALHEPSFNGNEWLYFLAHLGNKNPRQVADFAGVNGQPSQQPIGGNLVVGTIFRARTLQSHPIMAAFLFVNFC